MRGIHRRKCSAGCFGFSEVVIIHHTNQKEKSICDTSCWDIAALLAVKKYQKEDFAVAVCPHFTNGMVNLSYQNRTMRPWHDA
jgi:hypothetical protein